MSARRSEIQGQLPAGAIQKQLIAQEDVLADQHSTGNPAGSSITNKSGCTNQGKWGWPASRMRSVTLNSRTGTVPPMDWVVLCEWTGSAWCWRMVGATAVTSLPVSIKPFAGIEGGKSRPRARKACKVALSRLTRTSTHQPAGASGKLSWGISAERLGRGVVVRGKAPGGSGPAASRIGPKPRPWPRPGCPRCQ